jgi:hypothetical protein
VTVSLQRPQLLKGTTCRPKLLRFDRQTWPGRRGLGGMRSGFFQVRHGTGAGWADGRRAVDGFVQNISVENPQKGQAWNAIGWSARKPLRKLFRLLLLLLPAVDSRRPHMVKPSGP